MNILMFTLGYFPAVHWGGPVKIVQKASEELARRGHKVTVFCSNLLDKTRKLSSRTFEKEVAGVRVVYFNTVRLPFWPGTLGPMWMPDMPAYLKREIAGYDVVHLNAYRAPINLLIQRQARKAGVPVVVQPHGTLPVVINSLALKRAYDLTLGKLELAQADAVIALQEMERRQAVQAGVPESKVAVIPNGIDPGEALGKGQRGKLRARYGIPADASVILFLGRINRKKGIDMLVEAFRQLDGMPAWLVIAGPDDGQLEEIRALVATHRLQGRVFFPGLLEGDDLWHAYYDADLFVLPCRMDTFPTTLMEACLAELPMVITEGCEIAPLFAGRVAEVVPFDAQAFGQAMRCLLEDRECYTRYKAGCLPLIQDRFSLKATVDQLESLYARLRAEKVDR